MSDLKRVYEFEVNYLPFELAPNMPKEGKDQKEHLAEKFGGEGKFRQLTAHVAAVAAGEGLHFDYSKQQKTPNTRDAHRLIWLAKKEGVQGQVKEALLNAFFEKGIDLTKDENLVDIVAEAGLDLLPEQPCLGSAYLISIFFVFSFFSTFTFGIVRYKIPSL